jgi:hypothetical protein
LGSSSGCATADIYRAIPNTKPRFQIGNITVKAVKGGLDVDDPENKDPAVIASAVIAVRIELA